MKIEGKNAVIELLKTDKNIDKILIQKGAEGVLGKIFAQARARGIRVQFVDVKALDRESAEKRHQGVIAFTSDFIYSDISEIIAPEGEKSLVVLCDGIEDVHNLGSILRVAECAGADGVVIPKNNSASITDAVARISAGASQHIKVARQSIKAAIDMLKQSGYWIYALEADGQNIYDTEFTDRTALIIGGEDSGVRRINREASDYVVSIPMYGKVNSLNASVALGIAVYEVKRR